MQISSILEEDFIAIRIPASSKEQALNTMIDMLGRSPKVLDLERVRAAILEREKLMSTGVGHGKVKSSRPTAGAAARSA